MEGSDWAPASVIYGTVVGGFMFDFVQFVAKAFMRSGETRPPNIAGTPPSLIAIRGADWIKAVWHKPTCPHAFLGSNEATYGLREGGAGFHRNRPEAGKAKPTLSAGIVRRVRNADGVR